MHYCPRCGSETYGGNDHLCSEMVTLGEALRQRLKQQRLEERARKKRERETKHDK